jgi:putative exporter of polyketide antibiotics
MTTMTTSILYLTPALVDATRAARAHRARVAPTAASVAQLNVINPFARRSLGEPMSLPERIGILVILAVLAVIMVSAVVRADNSSFETFSSSRVESALTR